jgi:hypothetical protein
VILDAVSTHHADTEEGRRTVSDDARPCRWDPYASDTFIPFLRNYLGRYRPGIPSARRTASNSRFVLYMELLIAALDLTGMKGHAIKDC